VRQRWIAVVALVGFGAGCAQVPSWQSSAKARRPAVKRQVVLLEDLVHQHPNRPLPPVRTARASMPAPARLRERPVRVARHESVARRVRSSEHGEEIIAGTTAVGAGIGALVGGKRGALIGAIVGGLGGVIIDDDDDGED
jgi:hypothetical protein